MTLRLFVLQAHYRKPLDFTAAALEAAATGWKGLNAALQAIPAPAPIAGGPALASARERFAAALNDDLNTAAALAVLFELAKPLRALANRIERGDSDALQELAQPELAAQAALLQELAGVLGLQSEPEVPRAAAAQSSAGSGGTAEAEAGADRATRIQAQIEARKAAKAAKDFAAADRIRELLKAEGIELIDKPGGVTEWIRS